MAYIYKLSKKVPNSRLVVIILLRCHFQSFIDVHFPGVQPHAVDQVDITFFEVRAHLESILPSRQLRLDLAERVAEDREEHIEEDKEHEEDKAEKVYRSKHCICLLQSIEVKITQNGPEVLMVKWLVYEV